MKRFHALLIGCAALAASACTTTGNVERNAAGGAVLGGLAGAAVGNNVGDGDAGRGAAIGAGIGAAAGAVRGYSQDQKADQCRNVPHPAMNQDSSGRYFYYVPGTTLTCWSDGTPRS